MYIFKYIKSSHEVTDIHMLVYSIHLYLCMTYVRVINMIFVQVNYIRVSYVNPNDWLIELS